MIAAGAGTVALEVERVRQYPGGRWLQIHPRTVEIAVPDLTIVDSSLTQFTAATNRSLPEPVSVAAYTLKDNATTEAILGHAGALKLSRVSIRP
jgi:hypothetical protein